MQCWAFTSYFVLQGFESKASNKLVITSVAFQDHITRSLLHPNFSLSDPLLRFKRKAHRNSQAKGRVEERGLQGQDQQEEREYVLDSAPPPLTLGKMNTIGNFKRLNLCNLGIYSHYIFLFFISFSSEVGFGGLPCKKTDRGWMDSGQDEVCSTGGISSALCNMQGGVSPSAPGIPPTQ